MYISAGNVLVKSTLSCETVSRLPEQNGNKGGKIGVAYNSASQGGQCPTCLDPSTLNRNLFNTNYTGANNPLSYNGSYNYSAAPSNTVDAFSKGHDLGYDKSGAVGFNGVLTNPKVIHDDWKLVGGAALVAVNPFFSPQERIQGFAVAFFISAASLPKTLYNAIMKPIRNQNSTWNNSNTPSDAMDQHGSW